jgi:hypothetical protein
VAIETWNTGNEDLIYGFLRKAIPGLRALIRYGPSTYDDYGFRFDDECEVRVNHSFIVMHSYPKELSDAILHIHSKMEHKPGSHEA